ncbi:MAG: hypothetical protein GXP45_00825 [bacterium]|nr:hypothetical protein [bacterium]
MNKRLQQSSVGNLKVVLLENIERMTNSAANAFLKTCEEPLSHRIIVATTSNVSSLLDTIVSRAVLIKFHPLSLDEMLQFADEKNIASDDKEFRELLCRMVMGKP